MSIFPITDLDYELINFSDIKLLLKLQTLNKYYNDLVSNNNRYIDYNNLLNKYVKQFNRTNNLIINIKDNNDYYTLIVYNDYYVLSKNQFHIYPSFFSINESNQIFENISLENAIKKYYIDGLNVLKEFNLSKEYYEIHQNGFDKKCILIELLKKCISNNKYHIVSWIFYKFNDIYYNNLLCGNINWMKILYDLILSIDSLQKDDNIKMINLISNNILDTYIKSDDIRMHLNMIDGKFDNIINNDNNLELNASYNAINILDILFYNTQLFNECIKNDNLFLLDYMYNNVPDMKNFINKSYKNIIQLIVKNNAVNCFNYILDIFDERKIVINDILLLLSVNPNYSNITKFITKYKPNIHIENELLFRLACENGNIELVKWLYEYDNTINLKANDNYAYKYSKINGYTEITEWLEKN